MKGWTLVWVVLAALVFIAMGGIVTTSISPVTAVAQGESEQIGRYQISAWASYAGARVHHSGYYVLDTVTGKVVDGGHEIHGITSGPGEGSEVPD